MKFSQIAYTRVDLEALMAQVAAQRVEKRLTLLARLTDPQRNVQQILRLMLLYVKLPRAQIVHPHFPRLCHGHFLTAGFCGFLVCCLCHE